MFSWLSTFWWVRRARPISMQTGTNDIIKKSTATTTTTVESSRFKNVRVFGIMSDRTWHYCLDTRRSYFCRCCAHGWRLKRREAKVKMHLTGSIAIYSKCIDSIRITSAQNKNVSDAISIASALLTERANARMSWVLVHSLRPIVACHLTFLMRRFAYLCVSFLLCAVIILIQTEHKDLSFKE